MQSPGDKRNESSTTRRAALEVARDIELAQYSAWSDSERIAVNVDSLYREFLAEQTATNVVELFRRMAELAGFGSETPAKDTQGN